MKYVVFSKPNCPFCIKTEEVLSGKEKNFKVVNFEEDQQGILQEIKEAYNWDTVPIIFRIYETTEIELIGGYTDLVESLKEE